MSKEGVSLAIKNVVTDMMDKVLENVLLKNPFIIEQHHASKPLYAALVPDEIFKGSHFERRFVTPFGGVWERLAKVVAEEAHGFAATQHTISGKIGDERLRRIQETLNNLENKKTKQKPSWQQELDYILAGNGELIPVTVICDLYIENAVANKKYAFELKAPLPNSDQTKVSKEKLFKLLAMENQQQIDYAYFALPYNPYGSKENYAWSFPKRWFDMQNDGSVLIGDEFWNLIGGEGTYLNFISEINALGSEYKERIYREFLGIEPPENDNTGILR
jgi:hypothetical protein